MQALNYFLVVLDAFCFFCFRGDDVDEEEVALTDAYCREGPPLTGSTLVRRIRRKKRRQDEVHECANAQRSEAVHKQPTADAITSGEAFVGSRNMRGRNDDGAAGGGE